MDIEKLKKSIENHKVRSPKTFDETMYITIPFYIFYKKMFEGICKLQEEKYEISNTQLDVLASLVMGGGDDYTLSPTELYGRLLFSSGGMTKVLKKLEDKGYIIRVENKEDKRSKLVKLTSLGREIVDNALKDVLIYENSYFDCLDKKEKKTFENLLLKILENSD